MWWPSECGSRPVGPEDERVCAFAERHSIPDRRFNANAARAYEKWVIVAPSNGKFVLREKISSDEVAAYRAVPAGAP